MYALPLILTIVTTLFHVSSGFQLLNGGRGFATKLTMSDKPATTPLVSKAGKRVEAKPGTPLMTACKSLGLKVPVKCKKGECGTCTVTVAGTKYRACVAKVPPAPKLKSLREKGLIVTVDNA